MLASPFKMQFPSSNISIVAYLDRDPDLDFVLRAAYNDAWVGEHRISSYVAMIKQVPLLLSNLTHLAQVTHHNIAKLIAVYIRDNGLCSVVYEYVDMDLFEICPLYEVEIADVMKQVCSFFI